MGWICGKFSTTNSTPLRPVKGLWDYHGLANR